MFESLEINIYALSNVTEKNPNLLFNNDRMHTEQVTEFNFRGLIIDLLLAWGIKSHKIEQLQKKLSDCSILNL